MSKTRDVRELAKQIFIAKVSSSTSASESDQDGIWQKMASDSFSAAEAFQAESDKFDTDALSKK